MSDDCVEIDGSLSPNVRIPLKIPSPVGVFGAGLITYIVIWSVAPIDYRYGGSIYSWSVLLALVVSLGTGCILGFRRLSRVEINVSVSISNSVRALRFVTVLGLVGVTLRLLDRLMRGGSLFADFVANREAVTAEAFGPLAVAGQILGPLLMFVPLLIFIKRLSAGKRAKDWCYFIAASLYPMMDLMFFGGRSLMLVFIALTTLGAWVTGYIRVRFKMIALGVLAVLGLLWLNGLIFWTRTSQMGMNPLDSMSASAYAHFVPLDASTQRFVSASSDNGLGFMAYAFANFCQYYTHGLIEFLYLTDVFKGQHSWGGQNFFLPLKFLSALMGVSGFEAWAFGNQVRIGIYTTFWGPVYYDFGAALGCVFCLLFGLSAGLIGRAIGRQKVSWMPLYALLLVMFFFAPVVNLLVYGSGQTNLLAALVVMFIIGRRRFRIFQA